MKLCIISPVSGLEQYATLSDRHLVLAQITDPRYEQFYLRRKEQGDFIILDNGAYEGAQPDYETYLKRIAFYRPNVVVLPDFPNEHADKTIEAGVKFIEMANRRFCFEDFDYMFVPQAERNNWGQWYDGLETALSAIDFEWIGISKLVKQTFNYCDSYTRLHLAHHILSLRSSLSIHALGMLDGDLRDYEALYNSDLITSLDSSAPVWRGIHGSWLSVPAYQKDWERLGIPVNFSHDLPISSWSHTIIQANLSRLGVNIHASPTR